MWKFQRSIYVIDCKTFWDKYIEKKGDYLKKYLLHKETLTKAFQGFSWRKLKLSMGIELYFYGYLLSVMYKSYANKSRYFDYTFFYLQHFGNSDLLYSVEKKKYKHLISCDHQIFTYKNNFTMYLVYHANSFFFERPNYNILGSFCLSLYKIYLNMLKKKTKKNDKKYR